MTDAEGATGVDLTRIAKIHVSLLAGAVVLAMVTRWMDAASVLLGGAVMGANLWLLRLIARALARAAADPQRQGQVGLALVAILLKFVLFLGLIAALFWRLGIEGVSFAVGMTALLVACVVEAVNAGTARRRGES
jgi:O-antigen/teichoic acid export membrane protein